MHYYRIGSAAKIISRRQLANALRARALTLLPPLAGASSLVATRAQAICRALQCAWGRWAGLASGRPKGPAGTVGRSLKAGASDIAQSAWSCPAEQRRANRKAQERSGAAGATANTASGNRGIAGNGSRLD